MNEEKRPSTEAAEKPAAPSRRQRSALIYLLILFAAAFVLLLFAYLMQQRNSREILGNLSDLRSSITSVGSLNELLEENRILREEKENVENRLTELETRVSGLEGELESTQRAYEMLEGSYNDSTMCASMLETLYFAEIRLAEEDYLGAAVKLTDFDTAELENEIARYDAQMLHYNPDCAVLAQRYEKLTAALMEEGYLARHDDGNLIAVIPKEE